jgi:hypothetical protein
MYTRRQMGQGLLLGALGASLGGRLASAALAGDSRAAGRTIGPALASPDHVPLIARAQAEIRRDMRLGLCRSTERRVVVCPICCYGISVTAQDFS